MVSVYSSVLLFVAIFTCTSAKLELPPDLLKYIDDLHEECIKKSGITEEDHEKYELSNKDPKMMCYMKCLMLESGWMKPDGVIQYDFIIKTAPQSVAHVLVPAVKQCTNIAEGANQCEKAYNFHACMCTVEPENWFLV